MDDLFQYIAKVESLCWKCQHATDDELIKWAVYYTDESAWDVFASTRELLEELKKWEDFKAAISDLYPQYEHIHTHMPLPVPSPPVTMPPKDSPATAVMLDPAALQVLFLSLPPTPAAPPLLSAAPRFPPPHAPAAPPLPPAESALSPTPVLPIPQPALITPASLPTASRPCAPPTAAITAPAQVPPHHAALPVSSFVPVAGHLLLPAHAFSLWPLPAPDDLLMLLDNTVAHLPREGLFLTPAVTDVVTPPPMLPSDAWLPLLQSPALPLLSARRPPATC